MQTTNFFDEEGFAARASFDDISEKLLETLVTWRRLGRFSLEHPGYQGRTPK